MKLACLAALLIVATAPVSAQVLSQPALPDTELAKMRGGIALPGGANVAIGIVIDTQVDGALALRTVFSTETPGVSAYAGSGATAIGAGGVATSLGRATLTQGQGGSTAALAGADLAVQQMIGQSTGTIVANTANNRVIDTITTINIDLHGQILPPGITSAIESVARSVADRR